MNTEIIAFWEAVQEALPTDEIANWIELLRHDQADWFRNGGAALVAVDHHSTNGRGFWSATLHDANRAILDEIVKRHPIAKQLQP